MSASVTRSLSEGAGQDYASDGELPGDGKALAGDGKALAGGYTCHRAASVTIFTGISWLLGCHECQWESLQGCF